MLRKSPDAKTIKQLVKAGGDLSRPFDVEHFIVDLDEGGARRGAELLAASGYDVTVFEPFDGHPNWALKATRSMLVSEATISATRQELTRLGVELGGEYDGWGTPLNT